VRGNVSLSYFKAVYLRSYACRLGFGMNSYFMIYKILMEEFHNEELHNLYSSPKTITVVKCRRLTWLRRVPCMVRCEM